MKIAIGGIRHETSTFSPFQTDFEDFRLISGCSFLPSEILTLSKELDVELIPLVSAYALPGGMVTSRAYRDLCSIFFEAFDSHGPYDGVCLLLHGAMTVEDLGSGDNELLRQIRLRIPKTTPIACSLDLHANLHPSLASHANIICGYRTAPHTDVISTWCRTLEILVTVIKSNKIAKTTIKSVPVLLPGEKVVTASEPANSLYQSLAEHDHRDGILCASIFVGFAWADVPYAGMSVAVSAFDHCSNADAVGQTLSQTIWDKRSEFAYEVEALLPNASLNRAIALKGRTFISDSGDNITAGAPGHSTIMLEYLVEMQLPSLVAPIVSPDIVEMCKGRKSGSDILIPLQCVTQPSGIRSLNLQGKIVRIISTDNNDYVIINLGQVKIIFCKNREAFIRIAQFELLGINLAEEPLVVVKLGYLFPELKQFADNSILALSPGPSALDLTLFEYKKLSGPRYPLKNFEWDGDTC